MDENNVYLCFIRLVGEENDGTYRYEFIFTDNVNEVWGDDFNYKPSCLCNNLMVSEEYVTEVHIVKTDIKLDLIQNSCCFSISDAYDGIVSIAWSKHIDECNLFFYFGEDFKSVERKLAKYFLLFG